MNRRMSPNEDVALDAMLSSIAHEIIETISDPFSDGKRAWSDANGLESGDKCAFRPGSVQWTDGYAYNVEFGGRRY